MGDFTDLYTLSPLQEGMLFHSLYSEGSAYMVQNIAILTGELDIVNFEKAWNKVVQRHSILRTGFLWEEVEKPLQVVFESVPFSIHQEDWSHRTDEEQQTMLTSFLQTEKEAGFDLSEAPLMRVTVIKKAKDVHQFIWTFHHLLLDGWSSPILFQEVLDFYEAYCQGKDLRLPQPKPFKDYISWLRRQDNKESEKFWREFLASVESPTPLPFESYPLQGSEEEKGIHESTRTLTDEVSKALLKLSRTYKVTINTIVQGAWAILLSRLSGEESVVYGVTGSGRPSDLPGVEQMVGMFINTLPMKTKVEPEQTLDQWFKELQDQQSRVRQYEYSPLVDIQGWTDVPRGLPLFESIFVFENYPLGEGEEKEFGFSISNVQHFQEVDNPLTIVGVPGEQFSIKMIYRTDRFEQAAIERTLDQMASILMAIVENPKQRLSAISFLSQEERQHLLVGLNDTKSDYPREKTVPQLFTETAAQYPDHIAVVAGEEQLTYAELEVKANQLAHYLQKQGVGTGTFVGLCVERSLDMLVGMLGILKAGGAYVPLDPAYPEERLAFMLADAQISILLTQEHLADKWQGQELTILNLDHAGEKWADESTLAPQVDMAADSLAYVIYTSGSTGTPKGVLVVHRGIVRLIKNTNYVTITEEDVFLQASTVSFDAATFEIWGALLNGAKLVLMPPHQPSLDELGETIQNHKVTTLWLTAGLFTVMVDHKVEYLRGVSQLLVGGDVVSASHVRKVLSLGGITVINGYGPTENTTFTCCNPVTELAEGVNSFPIGRPISNTTVYVLDKHQQPVPLGAAGELFIGGDGLALGYLNNPELTAERFVENPFDPQGGSRLYRTGDLVRYLADGTLAFIGRIDNQVKIRGFRIELGEVEAALSLHPSVNEVVVMVREMKSGEKHVTAYFTVSGDNTLETSDLRAWTKTKLPEFMRPSFYIFLDAMPLTANGKIDRKRLPEPEWTNPASDKGYMEPRNQVEELIANIWSQVLGVEKVGIHDNFFELGGHSLLATRVISRLREAFGIEQTVRSIFEHPTIAAWSEQGAALHLGEKEAIGGSIQPVSRQNNLPLSFAQQRLWFFDQFMPGSPMYNIPSALRLQGELDVVAWEKSLQAIILRHESLRTTFHEIDGQSIQVIHPQIDWKMDILDLRDLPAEKKEQEIEQLAEAEAARAFTLGQGPLIRATMIQTDDHAYVFLINMHHIISDGWSMGIFYRELLANYEAFRKQETLELAELPIQYADFASWQREWLEGERLEQQVTYWKEKLSGAEPLLALPTDRSRPALQSYKGAIYTRTFSADLLTKLKVLSQESNSTLFMTLLAAFQILLYRYSGQEDIVVGSPVAGRNRQETENLIGFFVNTLALRTNVTGDVTFTELLARVRETALEAYAHQDLPFEKLVDELQLERSLSYSQLFQVMFVLQNFPLEEAVASGIQLTPLDSERHLTTSKFDLTLTMREQADGLVASFEYSTDLFDRLTIERMTGHLQNLLEAIISQPEESIEKLDLLRESERNKQVVELNNTASEYPREKNVPQLFAETAAQYPDRIAVVAGEEQLTYAELEAKANQLAHYLQKQGVEAGTFVGLCVERSLAMLVGMLGILKAGGAYVPLDPAYPEERLAFMLADAQISILLTQEHLADKWQGQELTILNLDHAAEQWAEESTLAPQVDMTADSLAYVIYTSGSTGRPKGVLVVHRGIVRLIKNTNYVTITEEDVFLQASTVSFDAATFEIWGALLNGAKLVLMPPHQPSLDELGETIQNHKVTTLWLTAGLFTVMIDHKVEYLRGVSQLLVGGDVVSASHVRKVLSLGGITVINGYGPTENTTFTCCNPVTELPEGVNSFPIGRPISNTTVYVLDKHQQPVPLGAAGELYIGGDGLALGYLNNPELTAERFVENPFDPQGGSRLYRTGDLVRYLPDGTIEFIGRIDNQVKIRGFRIELGEIETVLQSHPAVKESVLMVREETPGDKRLAAYLVFAEEKEVTHIEMRSYLKDKLPEYMIPSAFVNMDSFPLTPNGKVDRRALPIPDYSRNEADSGYVAPATDLEVKLAEIWKSVLGVANIGIYDNFFELGGDSILSIQIVARANHSGIRFTPKQLFENQTIAELLRVVTDFNQETDTTWKNEQGTVTGNVPLTPIQKWFFDSNQPSLHHWNQSVLLTVQQPVDLIVLEQTIESLLAHHDALRMRFSHHDGMWTQMMEGLEENVPFRSVDLSHLPKLEQESRLEEISQEVQASLNITEGPIVQAVYFNMGEEQAGRLLLVIHHLVVDGVSWRILLEDLQHTYDQIASGHDVQMPAKTTSFKMWAEQLVAYANSEAIQQEKEYWLKQDQEANPLPIDHLYEPSQNTEATTKQVTFSLDAEETRALLQETLSPYRLKINDVLLAALTKAMHRWTGKQTLSFHLEGHGREDILEGADLSRTIGWFTSMYPVQLTLDQTKTWSELLKAVKEQLRAIPQNGVGYGILHYLRQDDELKEQLKSRMKPEISFNYLGQFDQVVSSNAKFGMAAESRGSNLAPDSIRGHLIDVNSVISGEKLHVTWFYNENIHEKTTVEAVARDYMDALREIMAHCRSEEAGGYTPSDFPLSRLDQRTIDTYVGRDRSIENIYPLTPLQEGMLFHSLYEQEGGDYVVQFSMTIHHLHVDALQQAWQKVIDRHSILRTSFIWDGVVNPHQIVRKHVRVTVGERDLRHLPTDKQKAALDEFLEEDRKRNFSITEPPLMRLTLFRISNEAYRFIWSFHHVLLDGWSLPLVLKDWFAAYLALADGKDIQLGAVQPFSQYVAWIQRQDLQAAEHFWRNHLKGIYGPTQINLGQAHQSMGEPKTYDERIIRFSAEFTEQLQSFARQHQVTLNTFIQSAWGMILGAYSGEADVVFGATGSGRPADLHGVENMVGLFINTLPVRITIDPSKTVRVWLRELQEMQLEIRQYEYTPLVDIQSWSEFERNTSLFESIFIFENYPIDESVKEADISIQISDVDSAEQTNYPLTVVCGPGKEFVLKIVFDQNRFDHVRIERVLEQMTLLLQSMIANPDQPLANVCMISESEQEQVLVEWNDTKVDYPTGLCIHQAFEQQVQKTPDAIGLMYKEMEMTYAELNQRANQLAHHLLAQGVKPDTLVGICIERSPEMIVGILGVMKAGAAYVPIDPAHPLERIAYMIEDSQANIVLTQQSLANQLLTTKAQVICLDSNALENEPVHDVMCGVTEQNLAYVIYTSGSTGLPKGVMVEHQSAMNMAHYLVELFQVQSSSRVLQLCSFSFDVSVAEIVMALISGATLVIEDREMLMPGPELITVLQEKQITTVMTVPAVLAALPDADLPDLKTLVIGGEAPSYELITRYANHRQFFNCYGPTEATVCTTLMLMDTNLANTPIGRPIANATIYVLDANLKPVPIGVPGELYIGGKGLARGYWNRPELTAERFITHPFGAEGERLYRTGDQVRYLPDGNLEFLGRIDNQVKIRGFRIELGEIENALRKHDAIREAVITVRDNRLAAYLIAMGEEKPATEELALYLKETLPDYMIPAGMVWMEAIPLTVNGKVDHRALPTPDWGLLTTQQAYVAPRTPTEEIVANIWTQVLSVEQVGIHDDFFARGGHSLLATQAISRMRQAFGVNMPLRTLFDYPTTAAISEKITALLQGEAGLTDIPLVPVSREEHLPLSFAQQRLWFLDKLLPDSSVYNIPTAVRLMGELEVEAWERSLKLIIQRHESLRTTFSDSNGEAVQVIHPQIEWNMERIDLRDWNEEEREAEVLRLAIEDAEQSFHLNQGPLLRAKLICMDEQAYVFLLNLHHIIADGWSMSVFMGELVSIYEALSAGETPPLAEMPLQYADYATWQRNWLQGEVLEQQLAYWKKQLGDAEPLLRLPTDRPRPAVQSHKGAMHTIKLSEKLLADLKALSREEGSTLFMTLLAAFQTLLYRYSGQKDILVGSPVAGRNRQELESLIGFFINTLVMRTDMSGEPNFRDLLAKVRETALEAYAHQDLPFEKLVDELELERSLSYSPLFQVMFVLQNIPMEVQELSQIRIEPFHRGQEGVSAKFDITLTTVEAPDGLIATFEYNTDLFDPATIERMGNHFASLLEAISVNPMQPVTDIPLLSDREREQLLHQWNDTNVPFERETCVHEIVARIAQELPNQLAVVSEEGQITYAELDAKANQVANYLQKQGVSSETLVGICVERSIDMLIGQLGILKAGGAYVPMDTAYPQERLAFMMKDANMPVVVTQERLLGRLPEGTASFICLDRDWHIISEESSEAPTAAMTTENLAYVIYTSGSTGTPKGVEIEHAALLNLICWHQRSYSVDSNDRASQIAGTAFDASVWEIWPYLTKGATLYLPLEDIRLVPEELRDWLVASGITISFLPTPLAERLLTLEWPIDTKLRYMLTGGDKLHDYPPATMPFTLVNQYGPTENAVVATAGVVPPEAAHVFAPSIGRPIDNVQVYVLDEKRNPVSIGVAGELYIAGDSLARGYLKRPDLTKERFVANPYSQKPGARMYRTGDLVRYLPDGSIDFIGRADDQVSIRGFRVELGEIETALYTHPAVKETIVLVREDMPGVKRLAAYVVLGEKQEIQASDFRSYLKEKLPEYMVPAAFVVMDNLPLTPNGKVDRQALPVPDFLHNETEGSFAAPTTAIEATLADIWKKVLGVDNVGIYDNFFELGGDSILSIQIVSRANQAGIRLTPKQLLRNQTIAELASVVTTTDGIQTGKVQAEQGILTGEVPLTPIQSWFFTTEQPSIHHWNQSLLLTVQQPVDLTVLERVIESLLRHHDALRMRYTQSDQGWTQHMEGLPETIPFRSVDLSAVLEEEQADRLEQIANEVQSSLHVSEGPVFQAVYFHLGADLPGRLLIVAHHLVIDGVSWRILLEDLQAAYEQLVNDEPVQFPAKTTSFKSWAEQLQSYANSEVIEAEKAFWLGQSDEVSPLPIDRAFEPSQNTDATSKQVSLALTIEETRALLQDTLSPYRLQINDVLLTALTKAMNRWTGEKRVAVHLEGHGREEIIEGADLSRTVGWFTSMYPVQLSIDPSKPWGDALKAVKEQLRRIPTKGVGYGILQYLSQDEELKKRLSEKPKPEISFNYLGQFDQMVQAESRFGMAQESRGSNLGKDTIRQHLIDVNSVITGEQLHVTWIYSENIHEESTIQELACNYLEALREIIAHCQSEEAGGYTPSDFPLARMDQRAIDKHLGQDRLIENVYPLSPLQGGMLFHSLYEQEGGDYIVHFAMTMEGLHVEAFEQAWQKVVDRHPILRTYFVWEGLEAHQIVRKQVKATVEKIDLRHLTTEQQKTELAVYLEADRRRNFEIASPPLMRWTLFHLREGIYRFTWSFHHVLLDGWSVPIVLKDWFSAYVSIAEDKEVSYSFVQPFSAYIDWVQRQDLSTAEHFWREQLKGFHESTPLAMSNQSGGRDHMPKVYEEKEIRLSAEMTSRLQAFVRTHQLTLNTLVQGAWALILSRYSATDDVVFGATVSGRPADLPTVEGMVGLFINTLPIRVWIDANKSVREWLREIQEHQVELRQFEYTPLVDIQGWSEMARNTALFESIFIFENYPIGESVQAEHNELQLSDVETMEQTNYPITVVCGPGKEFILKIKYDQSRFASENIERVLHQMSYLLESMMAKPEQCLAEVSMISESELQQVVVEWNDTRVDYPTQLCIHQAFEKQVEKTPDAIALVYKKMELTYAELNNRANQLAHRLIASGVKPDKLVGICVERSFEMIIAFLGVMKAGAAYVPIDPAHPQDRIAYMIEDSQANILLTQVSLKDILPVSSKRVICLDSDELANEPTTNVDSGVNEHHLAYVIYTSGSTGLPKGVMVEHHSVVNLTHALIHSFQIDPTSRVLQFTSFSFDVSVSEIAMTLLAGATLVMEDRELLLPGPELIQVLQEQRITTVTMASSVVSALPQADLPDLKTLIVGGEALSCELVARHATDRQFFNCYGPTETTVTATLTRCENNGQNPTIGRPIANVEVYVLDAYLQPVAIGVPGELYIGGKGIARGYWNRPELTEERFINHHFGKEGERLYRTGDLVRYTEDGQLEFLGRIDDQVKIRGYRIELGEIENRLRHHPAVQNVVVIAREDREGDKRLTAYLVGANEQQPGDAELIHYLKETLPEYMVPTGYVWMAEIPLTVNGKVNRRALPVPDWGQGEKEKEYVAPRTPTEEIVAHIWSQVLSVEGMGIHDDFFQLGGHSLLATQTVSRLKEAFGVEVPLRTLFENPSVAQMSEKLTGLLEAKSNVASIPLAPVSRDQHLPLSFAQQRLWFLDRLMPDSALYNIPSAMRMQGHLNIHAWERSLQMIIGRHESLRTTFTDINGEAIQVIHPEIAWSMGKIDLRELPEEERDTQVHRLEREEAAKPFDLRTGPLLRATIIQIGEENFVFLLNMHHIVSDGWSMNIFIRELVTIYEALCKEETPQLTDMPLQYADFAAWQREWLQGEALEQQLAYWKAKLSGSEPLLALPTDRPRPPVQTYNGALHTTSFPIELVEKLHSLSRQEGATLFMTLLAAFQILLHRYSGQDDIIVGSPVAGRNRQETESLIGFFINTLAMRTDMSGAPTFRELLTRVRESALEAYTHQDLPFEKLIDELELERSLSYSPLYQVMFALQNFNMQTHELEGIQIAPFESQNQEVMSKYDISLTMAETPNGMIATFDYNTDLFDQTTMERMVNHFHHVLEGIVAQPDRSIMALPLLRPNEREQLILGWNNTAATYTYEKTVHELVAEMTREMPNQLAVVSKEGSLTYAELDSKANQLANYLQQQGITSETLVGICVERSVEMLIGQLGILKAGGAFVPMDPSYPKERLAFMMDDTNMPIVLTQERLLEALPTGDATFICLDIDWDLIASESTESPEITTTTNNLAYVIYTSGSTGTPKGVEIEQRALLNLINWHQNAYNVTPEDRASQIAGTAFDAAVWEIWPYLTAGATLYLPQEEIRLVPEKLRDWLVDSRITISFLPTPLAESLLSIEWPSDADLRYMLTGGDKLHHYPSAQLPFTLVNQYGPTENAVVATAGIVPVQAGQIAAPTIGRPIDNVQVYVLDANLQPVPIGVAGELYIAGISLARGYLKRPDLTQERFVENPFAHIRGAKMYRTGDLVRYLPDGNIEFIGRADDQVSIRGFRVELGEIETALYTHPSVKETIVLAREDMPGVKRLAAYVVLEEGVEDQVGNYDSYLKELLPEYMVPSAFVIMDALPLTPNGKVDRRALPIPEYRVSNGEFVAPETFVERVLAEIWKKVLGVEQVGIHDNFFELGGDSILSIQIVARAAQSGIRLSPKLLFENQSIAELTQALGESVNIFAEQGIVTGEVPLLPIQRWFFEQKLANRNHWNQSVLLTVKPIDPEILRQAFYHLLGHHDALRLRFYHQDGKWKQIHEEWTDIIPFTVEELGHLPHEEQVKRIGEISEEAQASLHLSEGPLLRAVYFDLGSEQEGRLLIVIHHLAVDGVSWRIITEDLNKASTQLLQGKQVQLPPKTSSYKYWAEKLTEYAQSDSLREEADYWLSSLDTEVNALPKDYENGKNRELTAKMVSVALTQEETKVLLQELPSIYQTQINDVLLTALAEAIFVWTGNQTSLVHLEGHGREELFDDVDLSRTLGWFTSMYTILLDTRKTTSLKEALQTTKEQLRSIPNKGIGYGVLRYLNEEMTETFKSLPKAEISFNYLGQLDQSVDDTESMFGFANEARGDNFNRNSERQHLLDFGSSVVGGQLIVTIAFSEEIYRKETVKDLAEYYVNALRQLIELGQTETAATSTTSDLSEFGWDDEEIADLLDLIQDK
ncbi:linear gramicidin non-ribosomal peptide synthetase LgrC [Brevibacillus brevis]|uniref:linear gramicidin non-ribosomal peptide synthetase LgrC n=1 Tax=Brevibacillus brevis TaxID=1393 RepID=UPI0025A61BEF|nr:linear gramicidin non-ribosomal peptide synthetase LgrC [Brevibacillus brevis]WJQ84451.1 linear gramicidin non-ribosomal peptide synthetase LgrC [Brevibacillus brevis]